jgi:hypothetical protein
MQKQLEEEIYAHHDADHIIVSVLHPANTCKPEDALWYIKNLLQDPTLSSPHSERVKEVLIKQLSKYAQKDNICLTTKTSRAYQQKAYLDGIAELGQSVRQIPTPQPSSCWHQLTFEGFVTAYCQVRLQLRQKDEDADLAVKQILIPTC